MDMLEKINAPTFDHVITDIPYAVVNRKSEGIRVFDKKEADVLTFDLANFLERLKITTTGNILIFCASEQVSQIYEALKETRYVKLGIWEKSNPSPVNGQYLWLSGVECCVVATLREVSDSDLIWRFPAGRSKFHPTEKPVRLIEHLVSIFTSEGDLILDPCAGSGSHLQAIKNLGRHYCGMEAVRDFYEHICGRGLNEVSPE